MLSSVHSFQSTALMNPLQVNVHGPLKPSSPWSHGLTSATSKLHTPQSSHARRPRRPGSYARTYREPITTGQQRLPSAIRTFPLATPPLSTKMLLNDTSCITGTFSSGSECPCTRFVYFPRIDGNSLQTLCSMH
jgi:hypothetical protein